MTEREFINSSSTRTQSASYSHTVVSPSQLFTHSLPRQNFASAQTGTGTTPSEVFRQTPSTPGIAGTSSSAKPKVNKKVQLMMDLFVYMLSLALIFGSAMFAFSNNTGKSLFGFRFYHVLTQSMSPTFDPGDMIFIKLAQPEEIKVGDIITFVPNQRYDTYLTHRVTEIIPATYEEPIYFITRGDHNNADDSPLDSRTLVGKYLFHIPKAGMVINLVRQNIIVMSISIIALFALTAVLRSLLSVNKQLSNVRGAAVRSQVKRRNFKV